MQKRGEPDIFRTFTLQALNLRRTRAYLKGSTV